MELTRRTLLKSGAGALTASTVAGCLDDISAADANLDAGYAAFFTLWDWAEQVSGDAIDFENPVGTGQAGHGWSPSGDLTRDIADAGVFVYIDTPAFSWAQDVAATLESDYDTVAVIDGLEGLDDQLLGWGHEATADGHDHESETEHGDETHDESSIDPHVWLDPVLAQEVVDTIASGLADADPDNAETYEENAASYTTDLESIDQQFTDLLETADQHVAVFAGHDSFTYLQDRYGFDIHTPVGVSPQEEPSANDISETIELVDSEGIETVLYDPFEDPDGAYPLVETILEESAATDAMPITHLSGTLTSWQDEGWGYVEQMEELNIPAFREVLDAQ
ncbi:zinc ABC transporter substrate-binding protein [Haloterrigena sp. H1]|uniref:metal ABC transporter substrate-binding protein n=1 Tax=Haloterrigena sp. H1 TaxID=2552943 RepID=UPI00110D63D3|nr:zinc ABC transporter substrate-binding protein [Haloterrigena sp. H1]TMT86059.1 zinc ABC transporter substrate-binding protein [Haloterrigena sp. H1]